MTKQDLQPRGSCGSLSGLPPLTCVSGGRDFEGSGRIAEIPAARPELSKSGALTQQGNMQGLLGGLSKSLGFLGFQDAGCQNGCRG